MKIKNIKVNSFGKLEDKEYELSDKINIIYGKNEDGKSTLLKFIQNIFYGTSKNKKGKTYSDYDLYKPWDRSDFSGKIKYELDSGENFEVYREFGKKNAKIYDENLVDISKNFNIDKTSGNEFFYEQTKVDEFMFLSSVVSMQQEVKLSKQDQNVYIQKIANLAGTGDDSISYKKAMDKLNKKQLDEIGTDRSQGKPINVAINRINAYKNEIKSLEQYKLLNDNIDEKINNIEKEIETEKTKVKYLKEMKEIKDEEKIEKEKLNLSEKLINQNVNLIEEKKEELNSLQNKKQEGKSNYEKNSYEKNNYEKSGDAKSGYAQSVDEKSSHEKSNYEKSSSVKNSYEKTIANNVNNKIYILISAVLVIVNIALYFVLKNLVINAVLLIPLIAVLGIYVCKKSKANKEIKSLKEKINKENLEIQEKINSLKNSIELLERNNNVQSEEFNSAKQKINIDIETKKSKIKANYIYKINNNDLEILSNCIDCNQVIENLQDKIRAKELELNTIQIDKRNIDNNIEKLAELKELLENEEEIYETLVEKNNKINTAKSILEKAYEKMKNSIAPQFTCNLSENIEFISGGKYKNVTITDDEGIIVELPNGDYVSAEKLSGGTIEQLYLSLRLSMAKEISNENMPIILDEAFAYYDNERLENTLKILSEKFKENQIIIFTCTNREKEIFDKLNKEYKWMEV